MRCHNKIINGRVVSSSFYKTIISNMNKNLNQLMHANPMAMVQLKKAKINKILSVGLSALGVAAMMYSTTQNTGSSSSIYENKWFWTGYGVGIAGGMVGAQAGNQMSKAAWFYNRDAFSAN
jgi:hypothetical protein